MGKNRVCYFYDDEVSGLYYGPKHPMKPHRITMTHHLVLAYDLHKHFDMYKPRKLEKEKFYSFHSQEFIDFLANSENEYSDYVYKELPEEHTGIKYGIDNDCPIFPGMWDFCRLYAGASVDGAKKLATGQYDIAINWAGGLHHGKRNGASGFCYVNDLVLAIVELLRVFPRVLYIDIDIHHGDGVEEAFYLTDRVLTCSFHKGFGFFPGTGDEDDIGEQLGKGFSVNVPLKDGATDKLFHSLYEPIIDKIVDVYDPGAIVLQCGADSLAADRLGNFSMTIAGGGGYTKSNVARCWTNETAALVRQPISSKLPHSAYDEYFSIKDKDSTLRLNHKGEKNQEDLNRQHDINRIFEKVMNNLEAIRSRPTARAQELMNKHLPPELDSPTAKRLDVVFQQHKYYGDSEAVHERQRPPPTPMPSGMLLK